MGYEPKAPPKTITPLSKITSKRDRAEMEEILRQITTYKAQQKEAKDALDSDKRTGKVGLNEKAAGLLESYGIEKTVLDGFAHTILNGTNSSISQGNARKALLDRVGQKITIEMIEDIMADIITLTPYTTIVTTEVKEQEQGGVTGGKVGTRK